MKTLYPLLTLWLLFGCVSTSSLPAPDVRIEEQLLDESFDRAGDWSLYASATVTATVVDGAYQMLLQQPNQYIWGTNGNRYDNIVIEADVTWLSNNQNTFAGLVCYLNPETSAGYYVVVSKSGDFSIRYLGRTVDDALISWRATRYIPTTGTFRLRVVCSEGLIALYINDNYIDGARDTRLNRGQLGLTVGMPQAVTGDATAFVAFDNVQVWRASLARP